MHDRSKMGTVVGKINKPPGAETAPVRMAGTMKKGNEMNATSAILESVATNSIVTIDGDEEEEITLQTQCDNSVRTSYDRGPDAPPGKMVEYWGRDDDGDEWRVHLRLT